MVLAAPAPQAQGEQASQPGSVSAGLVDAGRDHTCAVQPGGSMRCWGFGGSGQLGYGNAATIGDDEVPGAAGPVDAGAPGIAEAVSSGLAHSCALLAGGAVRCWGFGAAGQLGYGNFSSIGDDEPVASAGPVNLGAGRTGRAITTGDHHTCAVLDDGSVRCWGNDFFGQLGDGTNLPGDIDTALPTGPVDLGTGRTATAITAGQRHTCAVLDDGSVRCWGSSGNGQLGYGNTTTIGDNEKPASVAPVDLGGTTARAITAGDLHTCAVLDTGAVRCWGFNANGQLGYANTAIVGDNETPGSVGPLNLGAGRSAVAVTAGSVHTCALLDDGSVRCWGFGANGRLGHGSTLSVGDNETPGSVAPLSLGAGRKAVAISAGESHTCARLDDGSVRCWGAGGSGRLGYCGAETIGDDEVPGSAGPVVLAAPPGGGTGCVQPADPPPTSDPAPSVGESNAPAASNDLAASNPMTAALAAQTARLRSFRACRSSATRHTRQETRRARRLAGARRTRALRHARRHGRQLRAGCLRRHGRAPDRVGALRARSLSRHAIELTFSSVRGNGTQPPAARSYLVKQSRRPIRSARAFRRAQTLCSGSCRFPASIGVGATLTLTITALRPRTAYYYAVAARDNVTGRVGLRTQAVRVRTR